MPLLRAALRQIVVDVGVVHAAPPSLDGVCLIWPWADAEVTARPQTLIAIDGTWSQARSIVSANPWLSRLPTIALSGTLGAYRARREASEDGLATVEAVARVLERYEPGTAGTAALIEAFANRENSWAENDRGDTLRERRGPRTSVQRSALADVGNAIVAYRSGAELAARRLDDAQRIWTGAIDDASTVTSFAAFVAGASAVWAWRAAPFAKLGADVVVRDLKTLYRQRRDANGAVFDGRPSLEAGLDTTAALLLELARDYL